MKKVIKKIMTSCIAIASVFIFTVNCSAANYDANSAVNYARNHYSTSSELCAGFVARSIQAGGIPITADGNRVVSYFEKSLSKLGFQKNKLKKSGKNIYYSDNVDKVAVGDVILWNCPVGELTQRGTIVNWMHAAIVSKIENNRIYITQTNGRYCDLLAEKITVCNHSFDLYAYHWPQNTGTPYTVNFDANGGTCSTTSKTVYSPGTFGDLPVPEAPLVSVDGVPLNNKFIGWFTSKDDYGTQITSSSNVQLNSDTTLYARYGTGFTSYTSYWKYPGVLHIDIDNIEHYPTYRIAAFRGNESLKDAVILPDIIDSSNCQIDLDIKAVGVPYDEKGFKFQLIPAKEDGTCLFTPQEVAGSYSWYDNLGDEAYMKENLNARYHFMVQNPESEDGYDTYFSIHVLTKDVDKTLGDITPYIYDNDNNYVELKDKSFNPPAKEGYEFVGWYSEKPADDMVYDDTNRGEQITKDTKVNIYGPNERTYYAHFRKIDDVERTEVKADTSDNNITLKWNAVNNADSYNIYKMNNDGDYVLVSSTYANNASSFDYTDKAITSGNIYYYMIKPIKNGSEGIGTVIEVSYNNNTNPGTDTDNKPDPDTTVVKKGDVNNDGQVNLLDAKKTLKAALGIETLTENEIKAADVDNDTKVTLNDAKLILKAGLSIITLE